MHSITRFVSLTTTLKKLETFTDSLVSYTSYFKIGQNLLVVVSNYPKVIFGMPVVKPM